MKKAWQIWNELLEKPETDRLPIEQTVVLVNIFAVDFENGSWLANLCPDRDEPHHWRRLRETADAIDAVGAPFVAAQLRQIADIVETGDPYMYVSWGEFEESVDPVSRIDELESPIWNEVELIYKKLEDFTVQHFECEPGA